MIGDLTVGDLLKLQENPDLFKKVIKQVVEYLRRG